MASVRKAPAPKSKTRERLRQQEWREGERRARRAGEFVPIMGDEQNDPAADEHGAKHAEQSRGLLSATSRRFAVALSQSLRGLARQRSVAHEARELLIKPGNVFAVAHENLPACKRRSARQGMGCARSFLQIAAADKGARSPLQWPPGRVRGEARRRRLHLRAAEDVDHEHLRAVAAAILRLADRQRHEKRDLDEARLCISRR